MLNKYKNETENYVEYVYLATFEFDWLLCTSLAEAVMTNFNNQILSTRNNNEDWQVQNVKNPDDIHLLQEKDKMRISGQLNYLPGPVNFVFLMHNKEDVVTIKVNTAQFKALKKPNGSFYNDDDIKETLDNFADTVEIEGHIVKSIFLNFEKNNQRLINILLDSANKIEFVNYDGEMVNKNICTMTTPNTVVNISSLVTQISEKYNEKVKAYFDSQKEAK